MVIVMEYRQITEADLPQAKLLWKQAFNDSDAYIDFNFERNIDLSFSLGGFDRERLATMLYMMKKTLACTLTGNRVDVYFIAGVATDEAYRRQGLASVILNSALEMLYAMKVPVVYLYPFEHQFYKKQGYHTISWMKKVTLGKTKFPDTQDDIVIRNYSRKEWPKPELLLDMYNHFAKRKRSYFLRTKTTFIDMLDTMAVDDGRASVLYRNEQPIGYALYYLKKKKIVSVETLFIDEEAAKAGISAMQKKFSGEIFVDDSFEIPDAETEEYAMMHIVNMEEAKRVFGAKTVEDILGIEVMILEQY